MKWTKTLLLIVSISYLLFLFVTHALSSGPIHALTELPETILSILILMVAIALFIDRKKYFRKPFDNLVAQFIIWQIGLLFVVLFSNAIIDIWLYRELGTIIGTSIAILAIAFVIIYIRYFGDDTSAPPRAFDPYDEFHAP